MEQGRCTDPRLRRSVNLLRARDPSFRNRDVTASLADHVTCAKPQTSASYVLSEGENPRRCNRFIAEKARPGSPAADHLETRP